MDKWALYTYCFVGVAAFAYVIFYIVITIGGMFDLIYLFKSLRGEVVDSVDDGRARQLDKEQSPKSPSAD